MSNSIIRPYRQPCTKAKWEMKGNQRLSLHQTVDAKKGKISSRDLLIALRKYGNWPCRSDNIGGYEDFDQAHFLAATKQLLRTFQSVRPPAPPSVCYTFFTMFPSLYNHEIWRSYYQWQKWCPCKRSRSAVKRSRSQKSTPNLAVYVL